MAYSLIIALIVYRTMDWKTFTDCLLESAITSANTLFIICLLYTSPSPRD